MSKHTPGPWEWSDIPGCSRLAPAGLEGYEGVLNYAPYEGMWPSMHNAEVDAANMRLIAAAPELLAALKKSKVAHLQVDGDSWFSCPLSEDGCANEKLPHVCNCGADFHNARIDFAIAKAEGQ